MVRYCLFIFAVRFWTVLRWGIPEMITYHEAYPWGLGYSVLKKHYILSLADIHCRMHTFLCVSEVAQSLVM